uniref:immunoglobulin domain-containing protein n=2 Tax=Legionella tucsonensis TaxID=40335 RepID=UPI0013EFB2FC|nr:immunoglobulin domain-containing protein [Legionella tucsonensis]
MSSTFIPPSITTQPVSQTVTEGQSVTFSVTATGTAPLSYQWKKDGVAIAGATTASYNIPSVVLADAGDYTVDVSNLEGTVTSSTAVLTVNSAIPPSITTQPVSQTVTEGQSVTFSVTATGTAPLSYQWKKDGVAIAGATTASYNIPSVALADAGNYTVDVSNSAGTVISSTAVLTVNSVIPPSITTQPISQTVTVGQSVTFSVTATGTAPLSYQWKKNGVAIAGATTASYNIPSVALADAGNYTVDVSNSAGTVISSAAILSVNQLNQTIIFTSIAPTNPIVDGSTYIPTATATSGLPVTITVDTSSSNVCSISEGVVSFIGVGNCILNANQPGNVNYAPAPQVQQSISVVGSSPPAITSAASTTFPFGVSSSFIVTVTGSPAPTLTVTGTLPTGITFNSSTGVLSGISTQTGNYPITFTATNGIGNPATQSFILTISAFTPPNPTSDTAMTGLINAQVVATQHFAETHIIQITDHLQQLHRFDLKKNKVTLGFHTPPTQQYQEFSSASRGMINQYNKQQLAFSSGTAPLITSNEIDNQNSSNYPLSNLDSYELNNLTLNNFLVNNLSMSLWGNGNTSYGKISNPGDSRNNFTLEGLTVGVDFQAKESLIAGFAVGYATDKSTINHFTSVSNAHQLSLTGYATYQPINNWFVDALIGYGEPKFSNRRQSEFSGETLLSNRNGKMTYGSLGISNLFTIKTVITQLFCRADIVSAELNQFVEQGGPMALTFNSLDASNTSWSTGVFLSKIITFETWILTPSARTQYSYNSGSNKSQELFYTNLGPEFNYNFIAGNLPQNMGSLGIWFDLTKKSGGSIALGWIGSTGSSNYSINSIQLKAAYPIG